MLLTVKPPPHNGILPHEYAALPSSPLPHGRLDHRHQRHALTLTALYAPRVSSPNSPIAPVSPPTLSAYSPRSDAAMDSANRSLPSMPATPAPRERDVPAMAAPMNTSMPNLPSPPPQWQNESMRQWLQTKAEEYRREQEEERTRQESYRLDQRRVEQSMLRESLKAGVPPCMVPLIFASMGGGCNLQWIQQHMSQLHGCSSQPHILPQQASHTLPQSQPQPQPQPQQYLPPQQQPVNQQHQQKQEQKPAPLPSQPTSSSVAHHRRPQYTQSQSMPPPSQMPAAAQSVAPENPCQSRMIPPNPYASQLPPNIKVGQPEPLSPSSTASYGRSSSLRLRNQPTSQTAPDAGLLSHINTSVLHIQQPSNISYTTTSSSTSVPLQQASSLAKCDAGTPSQSQRQPQSSPSIYFHHWVPPGQSQPNTPSTKTPNNSPYSGNPSSHLHSEHQISPKKRKAQFVHQPAPPPPRSDTVTSQFLPGRVSPKGAGRSGGQLRHHRQQQDQEPRHGDLPESGRPGGQIHMTSLSSPTDQGDIQSTSRGRSNSDRERKCGQSSNNNAQFAGDHNGRSHGNYPDAGSRDDSRGGREEGGGGGGGHELSASYNSRSSSFNVYGPNYGHSHESAGPSNSGPGTDTNNYQSPAARSPIHAREDRPQQSTGT
ncbi:large tegument protein UL36 domain-containing protein [Histoplasma ohiense]|nr:large tegument protein UL36 domain-containing protein [Histoplasma ohiense (nom. inval.)]